MYLLLSPLCSTTLFTFLHWRRKWQPTPVFLPGESQGWGSLVGCRLWGRRVGHDWSDLAAAENCPNLWGSSLSIHKPALGIEKQWKNPSSVLINWRLRLWVLCSPYDARSFFNCNFLNKYITQISRYIGQWIPPWITQNWIYSIPCLFCTYTVKGLVGHVSWHLNLFLPYGAVVKKATLIYLNRFVSLSLLGKRVRRKLLLLFKNIPLH